VRELQRYLAQAISKDGFSLVEAVSYCHTTYGRQNKLGRATDMMRCLKEQSVTQATASEMNEEQLQAVIVRGVLVDRDIPEYTQRYDRIIERAQTPQAAQLPQAAQDAPDGEREPAAKTVQALEEADP
jgi:2-oxoglutarate ferredoxin oxidoreductase subunit beta